VRTVHDRLAGDFDMPGMPLKFSRFPKDLPLEAATLGQHNEEILTRYLGRSSHDVQQLRAEGVLVEKEI
jgi:CoA:oxalate CoA-transferase